MQMSHFSLPDAFICAILFNKTLLENIEEVQKRKKKVKEKTSFCLHKLDMNLKGNDVDNLVTKRYESLKFYSHNWSVELKDSLHFTGHLDHHLVHIQVRTVRHSNRWHT